MLALAMIGFCTIPGCAKRFDPFQVPIEEVRSQVHTIAISPKVVPYRHMDPTEQDWSSDGQNTEAEAVLGERLVRRLAPASVEVRAPGRR